MAAKRIRIVGAYPLNLRSAVSAFQREYVEIALAAHKGNISATAKTLGISRRSLQMKLQKTERFLAQTSQESNVTINHIGATTKNPPGTSA